MRRLGGVLLAGAVLMVLGPSGPAGADPPTEQGWWTALDPGGIPGSPGLPAPPDVPAKGLLIEGGATSAPGAGDSGPTAYAALVYQLPAGAAATTLTLAVAPQSGTTPGSSIELCPLSTPAFAPSQGGSSADGPAYDCSHHVSAGPSASGDRYTFDVAALSVADTLAVALLPTAATDRVVLGAPGPSSLAVSTSGPPAAGGPSPGGTPGSFTTNGSEPAAGGSPAASAPVAPASGLGGPQLAPVTTGPPAVPSVSPAAAVPAARPAPTGAVSGSSPSFGPIATAVPDRPSALSVALVLAAAAGGTIVWGAAGRAAVRRSLRSPPT